MPKALEEQPEVDPALAHIYEAFHLLSAGRPVTGFGAGPIPATEIFAYLDFLGIRERDAREEIFRLLRMMDAYYLEHVSRQSHGQS